MPTSEVIALLSHPRCLRDHQYRTKYEKDGVPHWLIRSGLGALAREAEFIEELIVLLLRKKFHEALVALI